MAVTVLDTVNNQWYVKLSNRKLELCHNRATANLLCREYNKKEEEKHRELMFDVEATRELQLQQASV